MCDNRTGGRDEDGTMTDGDRLRQARLERHLTQQALADLSGIERDKLAKIETGGRRMTGTEAVFLAEALEMATDDLLGRTRAMVQYRLSADANDPIVAQTVDWFREFVEDDLFLARAMVRYGLE